MKIVVILFLLGCSVCSAQSNNHSKTKSQARNNLNNNGKVIGEQPKINGIGLFKLGVTKKQILDSLVVLTGNQIQTVESVSNRFQIFREKQNGVFICKFCDGKTICPVAEEYFLAHLNVQGIDVREIIFKFYNDTLYYFQCQGSSELQDALNAKYGEAKLESEKKIIYCQNQVTGAKIEHEESDFTRKWRSDKLVECWNTLRDYYDDDCERVIYSMFYLENVILSKKQNDCWRIQYQKEIDDKKKKLDKF